MYFLEETDIFNVNLKLNHWIRHKNLKYKLNVALEFCVVLFEKIICSEILSLQV